MCSSANREIGIAYSAQPQDASRKIRPQGGREASVATWHTGGTASHETQGFHEEDDGFIITGKLSGPVA